MNEWINKKKKNTTQRQSSTESQDDHLNWKCQEPFFQLWNEWSLEGMERSRVIKWRGCQVDNNTQANNSLYYLCCVWVKSDPLVRDLKTLNRYIIYYLPKAIELSREILALTIDVLLYCYRSHIKSSFREHRNKKISMVSTWFRRQFK